jgi:hypothetical protein
MFKNKGKDEAMCYGGSKKGNTVWRGEIEKGERKRKKADMRQLV